MLVQQHSEELTRTLASPVSDSALGALPLKSDLANNVLAFDASGDPIPGQLVAGMSSVSAFVATLLDDATAAAARSTLGLDGASGVIVGGDIAAGAVDTAELADNAVDGAKIAMGSDAAGDVLYHNGTDFVRLAKGSDAEVLTLASGVPSWGAAAAGG